ncbi:hypothetical protein HRbin36_01542 [bacterium HR36]|nr:hypothetical protein HRbin36_01542 [bacterium HR36]
MKSWPACGGGWKSRWLVSSLLALLATGCGGSAQRFDAHKSPNKAALNMAESRQPAGSDKLESSGIPL